MQLVYFPSCIQCSLSVATAGWLYFVQRINLLHFSLDLCVYIYTHTLYTLQILQVFQIITHTWDQILQVAT
jgi:hypothetical protein